MPPSPQVQSPKNQILPDTLDFPDAMRAVISSAKVSRMEWGNPNIYVWLDGDRLRLRKEDGVKYDLIVSDGDMLAKDWIVV